MTKGGADMAEHIPKTDEEIDWEEIVHNAEKEDFQKRQKKSFLERSFETILEVSVTSLIAALLLLGVFFILFKLALNNLSMDI